MPLRLAPIPVMPGGRAWIASRFHRRFDESPQHWLVYAQVNVGILPLYSRVPDRHNSTSDSQNEVFRYEKLFISPTPWVLCISHFNRAFRNGWESIGVEQQSVWASHSCVSILTSKNVGPPAWLVSIKPIRTCTFLCSQRGGLMTFGATPISTNHCGTI